MTIKDVGTIVLILIFFYLWNTNKVGAAMIVSAIYCGYLVFVPNGKRIL